MPSDPGTLDPAAGQNIYFQAIDGNIHETLLTLDYLARPVRLMPQTAASMPIWSADGLELTVRIRPGIYFADDPAFHDAQGRPVRRELVAADYVYSIERNFDPALKSPNYPTLVDDHIVGLDALRQRALGTGQPFDYDAPVEGLRAIDRYTLRIRLATPNPRFLYRLGADSSTAAVAREVVEHYGANIGQHPVGTGPFLLARWLPGSQLVLVRNPGFRDERYAEQPTPGSPRSAPEQAEDAAAARFAARLHGRRLPMLDRVEVAIIEEDQPNWLAFLNGELDYAALPYPFAPFALPNGRIAPSLARQGISAHLLLRPDVIYTYFNMEDPVVGGYTPDKVALRRAIGLGYDSAEEIRVLRRGLALPTQGLIPPGTYGYDPTFKSEMSTYDPARANALLDLYGYLDRNGDGWRERPDGSPLELVFNSDKTLRAFNELWQRRMAALHLRVRFALGQWVDQEKSARAGQLMMWFLSWNASIPDGNEFLSLGYGPNKGADNLSRFDLPAYNALIDRERALPDGPERLAAMRQAQRLLVAYMPMKAEVHRIGAMLQHPWVVGLRPHPFLYGIWKYLDVAP